MTRYPVRSCSIGQWELQENQTHSSGFDSGLCAALSAELAHDSVDVKLDGVFANL